ncbi:MAG: hypothetical protein HDT38_01520 [Clostridiales bacterium]|nr:hypothetical protein [Clostridiales bacterium]
MPLSEINASKPAGELIERSSAPTSEPLMGLGCVVMVSGQGKRFAETS